MKQHKAKRKRLLVLALCLLTALSMLPVTAMAETGANSAAEGQVRITKTLVSDIRATGPRRKLYHQADRAGESGHAKCTAERGCGTGSRLLRLDEGYFLYL